MPWVDLVASDAVPAGRLIEVEVVREGAPADEHPLDLVVWRTASGQVAVTDSRCPHQWSHLGYEGVIDGEELVCLSHHWRFAPDGAGCKLNVLGRRDEKAPIDAFAARDEDGRVLAMLPHAGAASTPARG